MRIRAFADSDEERVVALWLHCGLVRPWNDPRKDIARKKRVQRELFLVAEEGGEIVGSVMAGYDGHRGWVNYLAVHESLRRGGLGRALMAEVETRLRASGCPKLNLQVRNDNAAALGFYERLGFQRDEAVSLGKRLESDER
ncbi:MAG TPA: GNAT family acetyltransferase [Myxococcota bacterium]|nr:GNAT family acetyltransferase [Myxococcota bacterium]